MKYYTLGSVFLIKSLLIVLLSLYYSALTRSIEKKIDITQQQINSLQDKIQLNELEYVAHLNPDYLERLGHVYFFNKYNDNIDNRIIEMSNFNFSDLRKVINIMSK